MKNSAIEQILLHLYDSIDYGFSYNLKKRLYVDGFFPHNNWNFKPKEIKDSLATLKREKLISQKKEYDGSIIVSLNEKGRLRALNIRFRRLGDNKKLSWDKKWRMVVFDIPNSRRKGRDALRYRLKNAGFKEIQESIFVYPFDCEKEIRDFIALFKLEKYVRFALLDFIDGQENLIKSFKFTGFSLE